MLVDAKLFRDPTFSPFGCGDNGSPQRNKPFKSGLLVWWDNNLTEWSIEVWVFRRGGHIVLIRQNGVPVTTTNTKMLWKNSYSGEMEEFVVSKVEKGIFANETMINLSPAKAGRRIEKILEFVAIGDESDSLPVVL
ncbi:MAG: hypothetical protein QG589_3 [Patescibacteria group bacterium]|nr:hypothetical protein [Patescibacteria group bacterium]